MSVSSICSSILGHAVELEIDPDCQAAARAVDGAVLQRRDHVRQVHRHRGRAEPLEALALGIGAVDAQLLAVEVGELVDPAAQHIAHVGGRDRAAADDAPGVEHLGDSIGEDRIGQHPVGVLAVLEQEGKLSTPMRGSAGEEVAGM